MELTMNQTGKNFQLSKVPIAKAEMLIRKPVAEVFEAFINPEITTKFWFTKSIRDGRELSDGLPAEKREH